MAISSKGFGSMAGDVVSSLGSLISWGSDNSEISSLDQLSDALWQGESYKQFTQKEQANNSFNQYSNKIAQSVQKASTTGSGVMAGSKSALEQQSSILSGAENTAINMAHQEINTQASSYANTQQEDATLQMKEQEEEAKSDQSLLSGIGSLVSTGETVAAMF